MKSWKPQKIIITIGKLSTNMLTVGEDCWGHSASCFIYGFLFQVISEKTLCSKFTICSYSTAFKQSAIGFHKTKL